LVVTAGTVVTGTLTTSGTFVAGTVNKGTVPVDLSISVVKVEGAIVVAAVWPITKNREKSIVICFCFIYVNHFYKYNNHVCFRTKPQSML